MVENRLEALGPAERIIQTAINHVNHSYHNRPGMVIRSNSVTGVDWVPVVHKEENGEKVVYRCDKLGNKTRRTRVGVMRANGHIYNGTTKVGEYRKPGLLPEVCVWLYKQIADVWKLDNEFAAKWASYVYGKDNRDMKVIMAAFMLVQSRSGAPVKENGETLFYDDDFRDVGEAMMLLVNDTNRLDPKLLVRIYNLLTLPEIAKINHELGFGLSARKPFLGRWQRVTKKWLRYREENIQLLNGLIKSGQRKTVMKLTRLSGYKPESDKFFEVLRWKQAQAKTGHRTIAIGKAVSKAESWDKLNEKQICQKIINDKPNYKLIVSLVPSKIGITRAIVSAAIEAGSFSDKDLINYSPTLEQLGLLNVPEVRARWELAIKNAENMRALNIATRVRSAKNIEKLKEGADNSLKKAGDEVMRNMRVYVIIDRSGSMKDAIDVAKELLAKFIQAFPLDKIHVSQFNTTGAEIEIKHRSAAGVANALKGITATGGTDYAAGIRAIQHRKPNDDEDVIILFIGDEGAPNFPRAVRNSGLRPMAFGLIKVASSIYEEKRFAVQETAASLKIPCIKINNDTFNDPYAIPNTIRTLIASTPVGERISDGARRQRSSMVEEILKTPLLQRPIWA